MHSCSDDVCRNGTDGVAGPCFFAQSSFLFSLRRHHHFLPTDLRFEVEGHVTIVMILLTAMRMVPVQKSTMKKILERSNEMRVARKRRKHKMEEKNAGNDDSDDEYSDDTAHYSSHGVGGGGVGDDAGKALTIGMHQTLKGC
ncbi:unnamed protein product [Protopolystoma xenopodis]|uniref:Uncharacterized protein n=1 Tax=Protopolystoma xenopodis TaxID=117903 RepID=A0A448X2B4_9PLAT|nr:unnamed protein product [Protopolystoma xenopodis]